MAEPILPLWIFRHRTLVAGNLAGLAIGAILIGQASYVPTYAQRVVGVGAVVAGFAMAAMTIGWPIAATLAPRVYLRIDYRPTALLGGTIAFAAACCFALFVNADSGVWRVAVASFVLGVGLGFASVATVVAVQSVVGWGRRGVVTGSNMFIRTLGSAVGIAVFGSIANGRLADRRDTPPVIFHAVTPSSGRSSSSPCSASAPSSLTATSDAARLAILLPPGVVPTAADGERNGAWTTLSVDLPPCLPLLTRS